MAELRIQERLQPSLLDRLTDDEPGKKVEAADKRVLTKAQLRQAVLRDLAWLLNATQLQAVQDLSAYPFVQSSVLNYGLPAFAGITASTLDSTELERSIHQAILSFEPRILPETLRVQSIVGESQLDQHNVVAIQIEGRLWMEPVPLEILLRTEVDLESGEVQIKDLEAARGV
jgi:type VI secretion system protein ImpF